MAETEFYSGASPVWSPTQNFWG